MQLVKKVIGFNESQIASGKASTTICTSGITVTRAGKNVSARRCYGETVRRHDGGNVEGEGKADGRVRRTMSPLAAEH